MIKLNLYIAQKFFENLKKLFIIYHYLFNCNCRKCLHSPQQRSKQIMAYHWSCLPFSQKTFHSKQDVQLTPLQTFHSFYLFFRLIISAFLYVTCLGGYAIYQVLMNPTLSFSKLDDQDRTPLRLHLALHLIAFLLSRLRLESKKLKILYYYYKLYEKPITLLVHCQSFIELPLYHSTINLKMDFLFNWLLVRSKAMHIFFIPVLLFILTFFVTLAHHLKGVILTSFGCYLFHKTLFKSSIEDLFLWSFSSKLLLQDLFIVRSLVSNAITLHH